MSLRLSGINPLAYMGVEPYTPPALVINPQAPTVNDYQNFNVGTFWLIPNPQELWYLASVAGGVATWLKIYPQGGGGAIEYVCDTGSANEAGGILNVLGDGVSITTSGAGNTITITAEGDVGVTFDTDSGTAAPSSGILRIVGGTNMNTSGAANVVTVNLDDSVTLTGTLHVEGDTTLDSGVTLTSLTDGVLQTNGSGVVSATNGTNGQVLIGGGTAPVWANITSLGGTVTITNGANSINLEANGGGPAGTVCFACYQSVDYAIPYVSSPLNPYAPYLFGTQAVMTITVNEGAAFYPGDGAGTPAIFTAPVDGNYYFTMQAYFDSLGGSQVNEVYLGFLATSGNYFTTNGQEQAAGGSPIVKRHICLEATATIPMTAGQQVQFQFAPFNVQSTPGSGIVGYIRSQLSINYYYTPAPFNAYVTTISGFLI
jgi:hypothetical protein